MGLDRTDALEYRHHGVWRTHVLLHRLHGFALVEEMGSSIIYLTHAFISVCHFLFTHELKHVESKIISMLFRKCFG